MSRPFRDQLLAEVQKAHLGAKSLMEAGIAYACTESAEHFIAYSARQGLAQFELEQFSFILDRRLGLVRPRAEEVRYAQTAKYVFALPDKQAAVKLLEETIRNTVGGATLDDSFDRLPPAETARAFRSAVQEDRFVVTILPQACLFPVICFEPHSESERLLLVTINDPVGGLLPWPTPKSFADDYYQEVILREALDRSTRLDILALTEPLLGQLET